MKKRALNSCGKTFLLVLAGGLIAVSGAGLHAQSYFGSNSYSSYYDVPDIIAPFTISVTGTYEVDKTNTAGTVITMTEKSVKWTSSSVEKLLNASLDLTNLSSYSLKYDQSDQTVLMISKKEADTNDVTGYFGADIQTNGVFSGSTDSATGARNTTESVPAAIAFDDGNGDNFSLTGIMKITSISGAQKSNAGKPKAKYGLTSGFSFSGTGPGEIGGTNAVFSGTISFSGSVTATLVNGGGLTSYSLNPPGD